MIKPPSSQAAKNALRWIVNHIAWLLYFRATAYRRIAYEQGLQRGMRCIDVKEAPAYAWTTYIYDRSQKPVKDFLSYREFMEARNFKP